MAASAIERSPRGAAAIAVTAFALIGVVLPFGSTPPWARVTALLVVAATAAALAVRRSTGRTLVAGLGLVAAGIVVVGSGGSATLSWFGLCVLAAWAAYGTPPRVAFTFAGVLCVPLVVEWFFVRDSGWAAWSAGILFTTYACVAETRQRALLSQLRQAQAELVSKAAAEERARIARELHDVIGHTLTVSSLHISSARLALQDDPEEAAGALAEAERLTRAGLAEVRTAVGLLKGQGSRAPLPGPAQIPELIESFRRAGHQVSYRAEPADFNASEGLTVYRILQEALTNAARHAPGSSVSITLTARRLVVDTPVRRSSTIGVGSGLIGMRERAEAIGGTLKAGPREGGWRVEAVLPS